MDSPLLCTYTNKFILFLTPCDNNLQSFLWFSQNQIAIHISKWPNSSHLAPILLLSVLAVTSRCGNAARILTEDDDTDTPTPPPVPPPEAHPPLSFFMHDILGGSAPSERVVAGITASTQINGLPFSKPNNRVFPIKGGVPLVTANNGININNGFVNNNNLPFLGGPNGATVSTVISNNGNNNLVTNGNTLL